MATTVNETERKYEAPAGTALPQLDGLPTVAGMSGPEEEMLEAEYYDTDDLRLIRAGVTFRRRRGGSDQGWHLKLPLGGSTRREIRLPLGRGGRQVPAKLAALVRVYTRSAPLRPVARITTRRQRLTLVNEAGTPLAEVAVDEVSAQTLGEATTLSQWNEVEVELIEGGSRLLKAADERLRREGLRPASRSAKLERALADQLPQRDRPEHAARSTAGETVLAYLQTQTDALKAADPLVRLDEPDAVHQMRVATRRLRSTLQTFGKLLPRSATDKVSGELKWLGGVLGEARDAEVLSHRLEEALGQTPAELVLGPVQARVRGHFAPLQAAARDEVLAALDSTRYFTLLDRLDALLAAPPLTPTAADPARQVLPAAARRAYRRTDRRMQRARRMPDGQARETAFHEARKAAKRARYAGEAVSLAIGKKAIRFTKQMKRVQTVLGDHHDAVVARGVNRDLGISGHLAGENAFTYGLLYEDEAHLATQLEVEAWRAWKHTTAPRVRQWAD